MVGRAHGGRTYCTRQHTPAQVFRRLVTHSNTLTNDEPARATDQNSPNCRDRETKLESASSGDSTRLPGAETTPVVSRAAPFQFPAGRCGPDGDKRNRVPRTNWADRHGGRRLPRVPPAPPLQPSCPEFTCLLYSQRKNKRAMKIRRFNLFLPTQLPKGRVTKKMIMIIRLVLREPAQKGTEPWGRELPIDSSDRGVLPH